MHLDAVRIFAAVIVRGELGHDVRMALLALAGAPRGDQQAGAEARMREFGCDLRGGSGGPVLKTPAMVPVAVKPAAVAFAA